MIAPNSSVQDCHTFALNIEHWFFSLLVYMVYNWNEDSFNHAILHNNSLSDAQFDLIDESFLRSDQ